MSTFKYAIAICGLSQKDASLFLEASIDTVKAWCAGRANPPLGIWKLLASLFEQIQDVADSAADTMSLQGINPRAWNKLEVDLTSDALPATGAMQAAGAMALLMAISAES